MRRTLPMARATDILAIARKELGYTESPAGSNRTKYGAWFGLNGQPWCMMFVQWCFRQADAQDLLPALTASCGALMRAAQEKGCWITSGYQPGDVVIYDFPGNNVRTDHCGIVITQLTDGVRAIEGNTGVGNDANGGQVMERTRPDRYILGAVRPHYDKEKVRMDNNIPDSYAAEAVKWAQANKIIQGDASGSLQLHQPCTVQKVVVLLWRFAKLLGRA